MSNSIENRSSLPKKEVKETVCPSCGGVAQKTIFRIGPAALVSIDCMLCGYTQDDNSLLTNNTQN